VTYFPFVRILTNGLEEQIEALHVETEERAAVAAETEQL
jgi:hypothetical protein